MTVILMCLFRQYASTHIKYDLLLSPRDLDLRSNFGLDLEKSLCMCFDASRREKDDVVRIMSLACLVHQNIRLNSLTPRPTRMRFSCVALRSVTMRPRICMDAS